MSNDIIHTLTDKEQDLYIKLCSSMDWLQILTNKVTSGEYSVKELDRIADICSFIDSIIIKYIK